MSTLKFWNKNNDNTDAKTDAKNAKNGRNWLHAPDALVNGHVAYLVKFLGSTPVDQPKGIEVVKEAIRRLQFTQQIKKAEGGNNIKMKKVEITISVDGVAIQEPRTTNILHQFPLHKISYCADEKGVKKFFSFIAKMGTSVQAMTNGDSTSINTSSSSSAGSITGTTEESHECYVFISNKLASDITLTIGQAFDLAYRRYMSDSGKQFEISKLQSHNKILENTVQTYRSRLREVAEIISKTDLDKLMLRLGIRDICEVQVAESCAIDGNKTPDLGIDVSTPQNDDQLLIETAPKNSFAPIVPPRNQITSTIEALKPSVGTKLEGLLLNSDSDSDFDPRAEESEIPSSNGNKISNDLFGFEPSKTMGQQLFTSGSFIDGTTNNYTTNHSSPPPLLAPPPAASRRNISNGKPDLFGADPFAPIQQKPFNDSINEFVGLDFSDDSRSSFKDLSAMSFNANSFNDDKIDCDSAKNPFLVTSSVTPSTASKESPKKSLFQKSSEMMMASKSNRYDVFKNELNQSSFVEMHESSSSSAAAANTTVTATTKTDPANADLFKDFAVAAFKEFKVDKIAAQTTSVHEFSNKLSDSKSFQKSPMKTTKNGFNIDDFSLESLDPLSK